MRGNKPERSMISASRAGLAAEERIATHSAAPSVGGTPRGV
jgi:hypothetical protein